MRRTQTAAVLLLLAGLHAGCSDDDQGNDTIRDPSSSPDAGKDAASTTDARAVDASGSSDAQVARTDAQTGAASDAGRSPDGAPAERVQDTRVFTISPTFMPLQPIAGSTVETHRFSGMLDGSAYHVEVPKQNWNGILVMYAHGYPGAVTTVSVSPMPLRQHVIEKGYAWAASSYSKAYYDVRAGVEDTNKLANAFSSIAMQNGVSLEKPKKYYIWGHSMGGHVAAAAVEREAIATAQNKVTYAASLPLCGVVGDTELFNYFAAYQVAAHQLGGVPLTGMLYADYAPVRTQLQSALFSSFPASAMDTTPVVAKPGVGETLQGIVMNLTGGKRPMFDIGFAGGALQQTLWNTFNGDGKINGVLNKAVTDTRQIVYQFDDKAELSAEEKAFNDMAYKVVPEPEANPLRSDGVRWIPVVNGAFDVPVLALHTLGDIYVPFLMEQIYRKRADAKGNADRLVQRAIRGVGHCDFTQAEQVEAFDALAAWEQNGVKPEGDDVLNPAIVGADDYGCKFSRPPEPGTTDPRVAGRLTATPCPMK
jgi:pimeloyl-ACP methyl ester carboxylesterase